MDDKQFLQIVSSNIAKYRKRSGLTQAELAEKLNYSDKSVSKWERGDGLPDAFVLFTMAEIFGISLNDLTSENEKPEVLPIPVGRKAAITALSICTVWLVAAVIYFVMALLDIGGLIAPFVPFIIAIPASFIVLEVFSCMWWGEAMRFIALSGMTWSLALCVGMVFINPAVRVVAAVFQVAAAFWFYLRTRPKE